MDPNDRSAFFGGRSTATATEDGPAVGGGPVHPAGHSGDGGEGDAPRAQSAGAAIRGIQQRLAELAEFANYFISAKLDGLKVTARNIGVLAALGIVGLVALATVVCTAVVMLLVGAAMGIAKLFSPAQYWAGALIVSAVVLGALVIGVIVGLKWLSNTSRSALVRKYEERQRQQRLRFGRDVRGREADSTDERTRR